MDKTCTLPLADGHGFDTYFIKDLFLYFPVVTFSNIYICLFFSLFSNQFFVNLTILNLEDKEHYKYECLHFRVLRSFCKLRCC